MTATEVARNFSAVLDAVGAGESVVITRGGEQIAKIVPAPRANGAALAEAVRQWQEQNPPPDEEWADHMYSTLESLREGDDLDGNQWRG
jgi:prevent-host-death family protein